MAETITFLDIDADHVKISLAALKDTPGATNSTLPLLTIGKDDVLIIEASAVGLIKIPITLYVIKREEKT